MYILCTESAHKLFTKSSLLESCSFPLVILLVIPRNPLSSLHWRGPNPMPETLF